MLQQILREMHVDKEILAGKKFIGFSRETVLIFFFSI
jgi:hypothetical protein